MVKMYQVSTLQALMLGYSRSVITVSELLEHGDTGIGTFEDVDGEMIVIDGICYRATEDGRVVGAEPDKGGPFSAICGMQGSRSFDLGEYQSADSLKSELNNLIEEEFGLNSMHVARIDGDFSFVDARSESAHRSIHLTLKTVLEKTQQAFCFNDIKGSLICVYFPDYMDGINASGWHMHFISRDKKLGGHVFEAVMSSGECLIQKIDRIDIQLPRDAAFDTYALKEASKDEIKEVEQGNN